MLKILLNKRFIGGVILINTIVTILLTFDTSFNNVLHIIDAIITVLFLVEIFYKICVYKKDFFKNSANVFDMLLILIAAIPLLFVFREGPPLDFNYVLLLRTFKLFKFVRFGKFIPNFKKLLYDFNRAFKASISLVVGGGIMMIIISTILTYIFKDSYPTLFGNSFESAYTAFKMLTIEGWYEIPEFMSADMPYWESVLIRVFFSLFVFIGGMLGMSFFISLIVDEMVSDNNEELLNRIDTLEDKIEELLQLNRNLIDKLK